MAEMPTHWPMLDRVEFALRDAGFPLDEAFDVAYRATINGTDDDRAAFEKWASRNVAQPSMAGYHSTGGRWVYRHNIQEQMWLCWQHATARARIPEDRA